MSNRAWRAGQVVIGCVVLYFAARSIVANWTGLGRQRVVFEVKPGYIVASLLVTWAMYALLVQAWRVMLAGWSQRIAPLTAARIWTVSSLGKYIPGQVWAVAGMAVMAQRVGVAAWAATGSSILLQGLAVGTGAGVLGMSGGALLAVLSTRFPYTREMLVALVVGSVAGVVLLLWPPFVRRALRLLGVTAGESMPRVPAVLFGAVANVVAWVGYGAAFWLLARGLFHEPPLTLGMAVGTFTAAYLAGFLVFGVPAGLGVRETVFLALLQAPLGTGSTLALAAASRILLTAAELGAAAPFLMYRGDRTRVLS